MEPISPLSQTVQQRRETREIVTPYAFKVADELLGTPLASPTQRGIALLVDLILVSLLTHVSSVFLAGLVSILFFRAGNRLKQRKRFNRARITLRFLAASMVFVFAIGVFSMFTDNQSATSVGSVDGQVDNSEFSALDGIKVVALSATYIREAEEMVSKVESGDCQPPLSCWLNVGKDFVNDLVLLSLPKQEALGMFDIVIESAKVQLSEQEVLQLKSDMQQYYDELFVEQGDLEVVEDMPLPVSIDESSNSEPNIATNEETYSVINWLKGISADLGIGFGWAAFYFTAFTFWLGGRTPGKFLMGIKVIKIDGKVLSLWECFGRYGGYGAGLATGLSGFLQVYWDPNRQAIHDKISETVVINTRKKKIKMEYLDLGESSNQSS